MLKIEEILERAKEEDWQVFLKAYEIAQVAHKDDTRDGGNPYMDHIDAVIEGTYYLIFNGTKAQYYFALACVHDVVEDHGDNYSFESVREILSQIEHYEPFLDDLIEGLKRITKQPKGQQNYVDYVLAVKYHEMSRIVKLADLENNSLDLQIGTNRRDKYDLTKFILEE